MSEFTFIWEPDWPASRRRASEAFSKYNMNFLSIFKFSSDTNPSWIHAGTPVMTGIPTVAAILMMRVPGSRYRLRTTPSADNA